MVLPIILADGKGDIKSKSNSKGDSSERSKGDSKGDSSEPSKGDSKGDRKSKSKSKGKSKGDSKGDSDCCIENLLVNSADTTAVVPLVVTTSYHESVTIWFP